MPIGGKKKKIQPIILPQRNLKLMEVKIYTQEKINNNFSYSLLFMFLAKLLGQITYSRY